MFCPKCGAEQPDGAKFCGSCGAPLQGGASSVGAPGASNASNSSVSHKKIPVLPIAIGVASTAVAIALFVAVSGALAPKKSLSTPADGEAGSSQTESAPIETEKPFEGFIALEGTTRYGTSKIFGLDFAADEATYQDYSSDGEIEDEGKSAVSVVESRDNYWIYQVAQHETPEDWNDDKTSWLGDMFPDQGLDNLEDVSLSLFAPKTLKEGHEGTFGYFASARFIEGEHAGNYYISFYIVDLHADGTFDGRRSFIRTDWPAGSFDYLDPASDSFDSEHVFTADEVGDTNRDKGLVFSGTWTCSDNSLLQLTQN